MIGDTKEKDLKFGKVIEEKAKKVIEGATGRVLMRFADERGYDFYDRDSEETFEIKYDKWLGKSGNFLIELFSSIHPSNFEVGWYYRYHQNPPDYLVMVTMEKVFIFNYPDLNRYLEDNLTKFTIKGVSSNPDALVALTPFKEVEQFVSKEIEW